MAKPANRQRGEFAVPQLGDGVFIRFTVDALERLESEYKDSEQGWFLAVIDGLSSMSPSVFKTCISASIVGDREPDYSQVEDVNALCMSVLDALFYVCYKQTFDERREYERKREAEEVQARLKEIESDPRVAALLTLVQSGQLDIKQVSDPTKSAA